MPPAMSGPVLAAVAAHDFTAARGALVASVPGYHRGPTAMAAWGHGRLRRLLEAQVQLPPGWRRGGPAGSAAAGAAGLAGDAGVGGGGGGGRGEGGQEGLFIQCSSMGSFQQEWLLGEFGAALAAHSSSGRGQALGQGRAAPVGGEGRGGGGGGGGPGAGAGGGARTAAATFGGESKSTRGGRASSAVTMTRPARAYTRVSAAYPQHPAQTPNARIAPAP